MMKRFRVLVCHISEKVHADGSQTFNENVISGLSRYADVSLVVTSYGGRGMLGKLVERVSHAGFPAIIVRPRTELAFDLSKSAAPSAQVAEGQYIANQIAEFAREQQIDIFHILQWGYLKGCLFEAALLANIPFVHTPYEYWAVCPQFFLRHYDREICSGPEPSGRKCWDCITKRTGPPVRLQTPDEDVPYPHPKRSISRALPYRINNVLQKTINSQLSMKLFGPKWGPLFGNRYSGQWGIALHLKALKYYLGKASFILPMNSNWANELSKQLQLPISKFRVCPPGQYLQAHRLPKWNRYKYPLQFAHPHRVSYEGGTYFMLEAWRAAAIPSSKAVLNIYGNEGSRALLATTIYANLIKSGSVKIHEGRIADKLDATYADTAAVLSGYQWLIGACGNADAIARGIPVISSHWEHPNLDETVLREGANCLLYERWNSDSLAETLRKCVDDPGILERIHMTCSLPTEFTQDAFIARYLGVYNDVVS